MSKLSQIEESVKEEEKLVPCKTKNCLSGELVEAKYTYNQVGGHCDKCLGYIQK